HILDGGILEQQPLCGRGGGAVAGVYVESFDSAVFDGDVAHLNDVWVSGDDAVGFVNGGQQRDRVDVGHEQLLHCRCEDLRGGGVACLQCDKSGERAVEQFDVERRRGGER